MYAGIELGGTKINCVLGNDKGEIYSSHQFPTTKPPEVIKNIKRFFQSHLSEGEISGVGIACFGPLELTINSPIYGSIKNTTKEGWSNYFILNKIKNIFENVPVSINTDVNGAALAEAIWGIGKNTNNFVYLTVGTGIGGAIVLNKKLLHGDYHPEIGHLKIPRMQGDDFSGVCDYHQDCLEGLASGPAIEARWGQKPNLLDLNHPAWNFEAHYLSLAITNLFFTLGVKTFVLGGGVMKQNQLFSKIQLATEQIINNYGFSSMQKKPIIKVIASNLLPTAGIAGSLAIAIIANVQKK